MDRYRKKKSRLNNLDFCKNVENLDHCLIHQSKTIINFSISHKNVEYSKGKDDTT